MVWDINGLRLPFMLFVFFLPSCGMTETEFEKPKLNIFKEEGVYCSSWVMTVDQVETFFQLENAITRYEAVTEFYYGACEQKGVGKRGGLPLEYWINAGGIGQIIVDGKEQYFGCKERCKEFIDFGFYDDEGDY